MLYVCWTISFCGIMPGVITIYNIELSIMYNTKAIYSVSPKEWYHGASSPERLCCFTTLLEHC